MLPAKKSIIVLFLFYCFIFIISCKTKHAAVDAQIVKQPAEMDAKVNDNIKDVLQYALDNNGHINDSIKLNLVNIDDSFYIQNDYKNIWSKDEKWLPLSDSMYNFILHSEEYGLFPSDYHFKEIQSVKNLLAKDSLARTDATLWTKADLILTDGFMQIARHLKKGRLLADSISLSPKNLPPDFFINNLDTVLKSGTLISVMQKLEPSIYGYVELRKVVKKFVDSMDRKVYTYVVYPDKDSIHLIKILQKRFLESGITLNEGKLPDSTEFSNAIKKIEKKKGLKQDGKIGASLIKNLNTNDIEKFKRIAITLDRYKQLPDTLPEKYIWVNLPSFYLQVWDHDTIAITSKTIVGKPLTRTPTLNSSIINMVTYPQWTIPASIIKKDILPALKKNSGYLAKKGFNLVDGKGESVDPYKVNWAKYSKGIPYKVVQGSGDDNALGILKFNFDNPYSVYLHDTNQRYLFKNSARALSHGCVRVQEWQKLAFYIARNDSMNVKPGDILNYNTDSITTWLANKVRKSISVKKHLPLFIRYFTCEAKNGKIVFYDDIYNEDKILREKYFANK